MSKDLSVVFIVGKGRSGSTIIGDLLGSVPGVFHAGELWRFWVEGLTGRHTCSCSNPVRNCEVWSQVIAEVGATATGAQALAAPEATAQRLRQLFTFGGTARHLARPRRRRIETAKARELMTVMYRAMANAASARLIVDTSKWPLDPMLLTPSAEVTPIGVHLVRNPHAVASSWARVKHFPDTGEPMPQFGALHTAASWTARNLAAEWSHARATKPFVRIRYEDFVAEPRPVLDSILDLAGFEGTSASLFLDDRQARVHPGHTIMGNPSRFEHGAVTIGTQPQRSSSRIITWATYPLGKRYGYR